MQIADSSSRFALLAKKLMGCITFVDTQTEKKKAQRDRNRVYITNKNKRGRYCKSEAGDPTACCADVGYQGKRKQELNLETEMENLVEFAKKKFKNEYQTYLRSGPLKEKSTKISQHMLHL